MIKNSFLESFFSWHINLLYLNYPTISVLLTLKRSLLSSFSLKNISSTFSVQLWCLKCYYISLFTFTRISFFPGLTSMPIYCSSKRLDLCLNFCFVKLSDVLRFLFLFVLGLSFLRRERLIFKGGICLWFRLECGWIDFSDLLSSLVILISG